ncbi:MAG TPA: TMEM175 family protein [Streptosporangiaceae bacterium]
MATRRAESFSDGVFAVAITLLVFDLLSVGRGKLSFGVLGDAWPEFAAYVVSFLTIGIMWLNHHTMLAHVRRVDRTTLVLNIVLLMGIVAVPFPTGLVAEHLGPHAPSGGETAAVVYGLVLIGISLAYAAMWLYIGTHGDRLGAWPRARSPRGSTLRFTGGTLAYLAGTLIAAAGQPGAALALYGAIAVYYLFEHLPTPAVGGLDGEDWEGGQQEGD